MPYKLLETRVKLPIGIKEDSGDVLISVKDNGVGIADSIKGKIFNPFFTSKPVGSGVGIGLGIAYKIVHDLHKGEISFVSKEGEGAVFTIRIPKKIN